MLQRDDDNIRYVNGLKWNVDVASATGAEGFSGILGQTIVKQPGMCLLGSVPLSPCGY